MDNTCGWAILTCPIERGPTGGNGGGGAGLTPVGGAGGEIGPGGRGGTASGGRVGGTGGVVGTGGRVSTGGVIGSGGYIPTGGVIGTGGRIGSGGAIGSGGYIPTGGVIGTGGYIPTGGVIGTGGYIPTGGVIGTGGRPGTGGTIGSFAWTGGGSSYSTYGYYEENLALSGTAFIITIAATNYDPFGYSPSCMVVGQFPAVPPPVGTYPIGDYDAVRADGAFVGLCSAYYTGPDNADHSISGTVVLSESKPGLIEGSFTMRNRPGPGYNGGTGGIPGAAMTTYTGAFSVGCRDNRPLTDPACAARTVGK